MNIGNYKLLVQKITTPGDTYYVFVTDVSKLVNGDYVKFEPAITKHGRTSIIGPEGLTFVRGTIIDNMGGLEKVLDTEKSGFNPLCFNSEIKNSDFSVCKELQKRSGF